MSKSKFPKNIVIPLDISKSVTQTVTDAYPGIKIEKYDLVVTNNIITMSKKVKEKDYAKVLTKLVKDYISSNPGMGIDVYDLDDLNDENRGQLYYLESNWVEYFSDYVCEHDDNVPFYDVCMVACYDDPTTITISLNFISAEKEDFILPISRITNVKITHSCESLLSLSSGESTIHGGCAITGCVTPLI